MPQVGLVLDFDHSTDLAAPQGRPSPAAGWLKEFKVEHGAIFARIEWTADAAEAVKAKKYRYVSPVFEHSKDGKVERILRAALTNNPALTELPAIAAALGGAQRSRANESARCVTGEIATMAKKDGDGTPKLSEIMEALERAHPGASHTKLMKAAAALLADDDEDEEEEEEEKEEEEAAAAGDDPFDKETAEQMAARQQDEMARCASDDERAETAARHAAERERFAKRVGGLEHAGRPGGGPGKDRDGSEGTENMSNTRRSAAEPSKGVCDVRNKSDIDAAVAKHPMVVKMAEDLNQMRAAQARKTAELAVDNAIREGRLVPSQRDWGIEYCTGDPKGFERFIGAQPKILQAGPDGTFTGQIGEAPKDALTQKELMVCEKLGITAEKFAAAKKERLSYNVHLE